MAPMKPIKLTPKNTPKGWCLDIPPAISSTGKRQRQFFPSLDAAERAALPLRKKMRTGDAAVIVMPKLEGAAARRALTILTEAGFSPLAIVQGAEMLVEARNTAGKSVTFQTAAESYVRERSKVNRTAAHLADFGRLCRRFPDFAGTLLCDIDRATLKTTLAPLPSSAHNLALREIRAVFNYGMKEGWCQANPAASLDLADTGKPKVPTLTAKQVRRLFTAAIRLHPELVPLLAVQTFAGVRPIESTKLTWDNIELEDEKVLTVPAEVAKTGNARHIDLHPTAVAWLEWHKARGGATEGLLCPLAVRGQRPKGKKSKAKPTLGRDSSMPEALRDALQAVRARAGINPWPQDGLRHTFASASLAAKWRDIPGICADLGHGSLKMLRKHYERAMRRAPAEAVFAVTPPERIKGMGKIVQFSAA